MFIPLVALPDRGGDGGSVGGGTFRLIFVRDRFGGTRAAEQFVQPLGVNLAAQKIGFSQNALE